MYTKLIINNEYVETARYSTINDPEDGSVVGNLANATKTEVDRTFSSAKAAFSTWKNIPAHERLFKLEQVAGALLTKKNEIAATMVAEIAKPLKDCVKEVERSAEYILFTIQAYRTLEGRVLDGDKMPGYNQSQKTAFVTYEPMGVILAISPFNYPINLAITKIAPALAAGNCVILKPSTAGAISAYLMSEIFAGIFPPGVYSFISGKSSEIGDYVVTHPDVSMIAFTGSTATGRHIQHLASAPIYLEMGGKDAAVVFADADLDRAVSEITKGAFSYSAQRCTAVKRVIIEESIAEEFISKLKIKVSELKIGSAKQNADITPIVSSATVDYLKELSEDAISKGANVMCGNIYEGNYAHPTIFDRVTKEMRLYREEPFGPLLPIIRVADYDEAIAVANDSEYGLQADIFTQDVNKAFSAARSLNAGTVQINGKSDRGPDNFPFPGIKDSGMGVAGLKDAILSMVRTKVIVLNSEWS